MAFSFQRIVLILLSAILTCSVQAQQYRVGPAGLWVEQHDLEGLRVTDTACIQWGGEVLLLDRQYHLGNEEIFWRRAERLISSEGVQNGSRIEVSFDPSFQKLTFHHVRILRDGKTIDQLVKGTTRVLHREEDLGSHLYDGSLTVVVELHDVRVGDIVDQAMTIQGWNPVDKGRFHRFFGMGYSAPVARNFTRVVMPPGRTPDLLEHQFDVKALERTSSFGNEWVWDLGPLDCVLADQGAPGWYKAYPAIDISEFRTVEELRTWALEQYALDATPSGALAKRIAAIKALPTPMERVDSAVNLVQREVRYLGLEDGISAYRPHSPSQVFDQRYGDCKDKSFLLTTILRNIGVEAYPALVNTSSGRALDTWLPRPSLFDHCITMTVVEDDTLWVDATQRNNGGRGVDRYTPNYGLALVVGNGFEGYTPMSVRDTGYVDVLEHFKLDTLARGGELEVEAIYRGRRADLMRGSLASGSLHDLAKTYRDFYTGLYGAVEELEPLQYEDDVQVNVIRTYERYRLVQPWDTLLGKEQVVFNTTAHHIRDHQSKPGKAMRTAPFYLGEPLVIRHSITVDLPSDWTIEPEHVEFEGQGVRYTKDVTLNGKRSVTLDHRYASAWESVPAEEAGELQSLQESIAEDLYFEFTSSLGGTGTTSSGEWGKWGFIAFCIGACAFLAIKLYRYDPPPHLDAFGKPAMSIGSFLILPAIGLCISPIAVLYQMFSDDMIFFYATDYSAVISPEEPFAVDLYMHASQFFAFAQLAIVILCIVLFFNRRTSAPLFMKVMYALSAIWLVVDLTTYNALGFREFTGEVYPVRDVTRAIIAAVIWIPVFQLSGRVRQTFTVQLDPVPAQVVQVAEPVSPEERPNASI